MKITDAATKDLYYEALVNRDSKYLGTFYAAVKTTSIFCIPTCSARKPLAKNVEYYTTSQEAIQNDYRACKRCHPLQSQS